MARYDLVALGELLYVLRAPHATLLEQTRTLQCHCGGTEANVAVGVTRLGWRAAHLTKVCDNFIGRFVTSSLHAQGVDTSRAIWTDGMRMGILYEEFGIPPRPSENVYDRQNTAFTELEPDEIDWSILHSADHLLTSGVTASLGERPRQLVRRALREAKTAGAQVVYDCNYRGLLWSADEARRFTEPLLDMVDVLFVKVADARVVFGLDDEPERIIDALRDQHDIGIVVVTQGSAGATAGDGRIRRAAAIDMQVINRFGMGDAFVAGFLWGYEQGGLTGGLDYGRALAALKATYTNENFAMVTRKAVERLIGAVDEQGRLTRGDIVR